MPTVVPTFQCAYVCVNYCARVLVTGRVSGEEQRCLSSGVLQRNVQHSVEVLSVFTQTLLHTYWRNTQCINEMHLPSGPWADATFTTQLHLCVQSGHFWLHLSTFG